MKRSIAILFALLAPSQGYVTSHSAIPPNRQVAWLKKLTDEVVESQGPLSDEMLQVAQQVSKGWASTKSYNNVDKALAVENLLKRLVEESAAGNSKAAPSTSDYNTLLDGWYRSDQGVFAAERCEQILTEMQTQYEQGNSNVQPDLTSFKIAIMAWRQASQQSFSSYRGQRLLEWMTALYTTGKNDQALPDSDCFDIVLQSWSKNTLPKAPRNAEKLLGTMEHLSNATGNGKLKPDTTSFNAVLGAWLRSSAPQAWKRTYDILGFMQKLYYLEGNKRVAPDLVTYHIVLQALSRADDAKASAPKAEKILRFLEQEYKAGSLGYAPDTILFNSAMGCWAKSNVSGSYRKARSLLDRQLNIYAQGNESAKPDIVGFTSVLSSCASESGGRTERLKAFNVALSTFQQAMNREDLTPNHVTYGTMLKCCARLLPQGCHLRQRWTKQLFEECADKGLVGGMVLSRLREAATPGEFRQLMQGYTKKTVPKSWTRNVYERNDYRKKGSNKNKNKNRKRAEV